MADSVEDNRRFVVQYANPHSRLQADKKYYEAPMDQDDNERFVMNVVSDLIKEIENPIERKGRPSSGIFELNFFSKNDRLQCLWSRPAK